MARKRRQFSPFSLSFLDIMSCGFGAVVLLFLIIKHNVEAHVPDQRDTPDLTSEVNLLEKEVLEGQKGLAELRNTIEEVDLQVVIAEGLARRIQETVRETEGDMETIKSQSASDELAMMEVQVRELEKKKRQLEEEADKAGEDARTFAGEGTRQYLTGLRLDGRRILLLVDVSASMLDETIVNIIRRKVMPPERKLGARKWTQAVDTVDWLTARFPVGSQYQIYTFNTEVKAAIAGTEGKWLRVEDLPQLNDAVSRVRRIVPDEGTSLEKAFMAVKNLSPLPDSIVLITDGLPTQGRKPPRFGNKVSGNERRDLFDAAIKQLPAGIPVNVILSPMEGDPMAAHAFWGLAVLTKGSFMSPAADWP